MHPYQTKYSKCAIFVIESTRVSLKLEHLVVSHSVTNSQIYVIFNILCKDVLYNREFYCIITKKSLRSHTSET